MAGKSQSVPLLIPVKRHGDQRGWFAETYSAQRLAMLGLSTVFVQDNHSFSAAKGTLRGLHFQTPPHGQAKLIRCLRGSIWDVVVDIRKNSPSFGKSVSAELSAENGDQLFVPVGFAHGFVTLTDNTEIAYKVSSLYAPDHDDGIAWNDPDCAINWPLDGAQPHLSGKDQTLQKLADFDSPFLFDGVPLADLERAT